MPPSRSPSSPRPGSGRWPAAWAVSDCRVPELCGGRVQDRPAAPGTLPGIGPKRAQRIAFRLLSVEPPDIARLTGVLARIRDGVTFCAVCGNVSEEERCRICKAP